MGLLGSREERCSCHCEELRAHLEVRRSTSIYRNYSSLPFHVTHLHGCSSLSIHAQQSVERVVLRPPSAFRIRPLYHRLLPPPLPPTRPFTPLSPIPHYSQYPLYDYSCKNKLVYRSERENSKSKTLFYKDCSLGPVKNLTASPC